MEFNINEKDGYKTFIEKLRKELMHSTFNGIPVLMPETEPFSWLDVQLIAGDLSITLRIDRRNLNVLGYSRNGDAHFWEFNDSSLIPGSRRLGYGAEGLTDTAGLERKNCLLGYHPLHNAISNLADMENPSSDQARSAKSLLTVIQMIAEAARFELIAAPIFQNWWNAQPITIDSVDIDSTVGTLALSSRMLTLMHSRHLVSIEHVCLNSIHGKSLGELHGTVTVEDCFDCHTVYERSSDNTESKGPGDYASLSGPCTDVSGEDLFTISVSLWDHDDEIAKGDIVCDALWGSLYDIPLVEDVSGEYGSVSVAYSVASDALSATVAVVLINGDGESPIDVYGSIKATIKLGSQFQLNRMLFDKSKDEYEQVRPQEHVPLTRPVFPVSVASHVIIEADLWDHGSLSPEDQIAWGSVKFIPSFGTQHKNIIGKCGEVKVSITWA